MYQVGIPASRKEYNSRTDRERQDSALQGNGICQQEFGGRERRRIYAGKTFRRILGQAGSWRARKCRQRVKTLISLSLFFLNHLRPPDLPPFPVQFSLLI